MSGSRRKFLKAGMLAALFAAVPLKDVLGQSWKGRDGNPGEGPSSGAQNDPLAFYSKATFKSYLNSVFQLHTVAGAVGITLLQVDDMPAPKGGECFSLLFRGGSGRQLTQNTYQVDHPSLGTFLLFLVPVGTDQNGAQGYIATINRLSYTDALIPAPTRSGATQRTAAPPAIPATASPTTSAPAQPTLPAPTPVTTPSTVKPLVKPRRARKRKPSRKSNDDGKTLTVS